MSYAPVKVALLPMASAPFGVSFNLISEFVKLAEPFVIEVAQYLLVFKAPINVPLVPPVAPSNTSERTTTVPVAAVLGFTNSKGFKEDLPIGKT